MAGKRKERHLQGTELEHLQRVPRPAGVHHPVVQRRSPPPVAPHRSFLLRGSTPSSTAALPLPACWWCGNSFGFPIGSWKGWPAR